MMDEIGIKRLCVLDALQRAIEDWARCGNEQPLTRWLERELDSQGALFRLPISDWHRCVDRLLETRRRARAWPSRWNSPMLRLVKAALWFSRRDGVPVIDFDPSTPKIFTGCKGSADRTDPIDPSGDVERVIQSWLSRATSWNSDGTRPDWGGSKRVIEVLRPGWPVTDDFLAVDHRDTESPCRFELFGAGRSWLGPSWEPDAGRVATSAPRPRAWIEAPSGILAEWTYRAGNARVTQSALILRERSLALLSLVVEHRAAGPSVLGMRVSLPPGIAARPVENCRGVVLNPASHRGSALVLPIGLPSLPYPTERGAFVIENNSLVLNQALAGRRCWLPLLVSWNTPRHRKEVHWRLLSVSEKSRNVTSDRAFAVRVRWSRDETYVFYRSLAKPAPRAFLGHQTTARLLVGLFTRDGAVEPIFTVD